MKLRQEYDFCYIGKLPHEIEYNVYCFPVEQDYDDHPILYTNRANIYVSVTR